MAFSFSIIQINFDFSGHQGNSLTENKYFFHWLGPSLSTLLSKYGYYELKKNRSQLKW